jgi:hypothetical protein
LHHRDNEPKWRLRQEGIISGTEKQIHINLGVTHHNTQPHCLGQIRYPRYDINQTIKRLRIINKLFDRIADLRVYPALQLRYRREVQSFEEETNDEGYWVDVQVYLRKSRVLYL